MGRGSFGNRSGGRRTNTGCRNSNNRGANGLRRAMVVRALESIAWQGCLDGSVLLETPFTCYITKVHRTSLNPVE